MTYMSEFPPPTSPERPPPKVRRPVARLLPAGLAAGLGALLLARGLTWGPTWGPTWGLGRPPLLLGLGSLAFCLSLAWAARAWVGGAWVNRGAGLSAPPAVPSVTGTVLVVDDEPIVRDLARMALERSGFRVLEARDGLEAVALFRTGREPVDLVLLDMTMPLMGGAEAFRLIRGLAPGVRVLLTSGYTQSESLEDLADLPLDGFLQKPFRVGQLVDRARELLGG